MEMDGSFVDLILGLKKVLITAQTPTSVTGANKSRNIGALLELLMSHSSPKRYIVPSIRLNSIFWNELVNGTY